MLAFLSYNILIFVSPVSAMVPLAKQCAFEEPSVEIISGENILTWPHVVSPFLFDHIVCLVFTTLVALQ